MYNFILICDDNYVMSTCVTIKSITYNFKKRSNLAFHILTAGINDDNFKVLKSMEGYNTEIFVYQINLEAYAGRIEKIRTKTHVSHTALLKFEIANILDEIDLALYIDSDIIVKKDLSVVFEYETNDFFLGAVNDLWKFVNQDDNSFYFNSGVLLINLKKWRECNIAEQLWKEKIRIANNPKYKTMDQDTFNNVLGKKCIKLPIYFNFNPYFCLSKYLVLIQKYGFVSERNMNDIIDNVSVIHYVGKEDKPWLYETARMREEWDSYYVACFGDLDNLHRISLKKNINYYLRLVKNAIKRRGIVDTIRRIINRLKR